MSIVCVCETVKIQYDNISTCKYSIHTRPPLGRYAPSFVWAPLFKNSRSAPACGLKNKNFLNLTVYKIHGFEPNLSCLIHP